MPMELRIVCPDSCPYDGEAAFVTLPTTDGETGVAPLHASEISTIGPGYVRVCNEKMGQVDRTFAVSGGYKIWPSSTRMRFKPRLKVLKTS